MAETAHPEKNSQITTQQVIHDRVAATRLLMKSDPSFNAIRGMELCFNDIIGDMRKNGLPMSEAPISATIGDINALKFGGDFEKDYDVADELALDPEGKLSRKEEETIREIRIKYKREGKSLTSYDAKATGTLEARTAMAAEVGKFGLQASADDIWLSYGGMDALQRIFRALNCEAARQDPWGEKQAVLYEPAPFFTMANNAARDMRLSVHNIDVSKLPGQELDAEKLHEFADGRPVPYAILLTPANNPTATAMDPERLRGVIREMKIINPNAIFIFDMAYMGVIPEAKAKAIMTVIDEETDRSIFAISESKRWGRPGSRMGGIITRNKDLKRIIQTDTTRNFPTFCSESDVKYQALAKLVTPEAVNHYKATLRQRQYAFLEVLRHLDPNKEIFDNLDGISIPGYPSDNPKATQMDVPLYLWLKLKKGVDPFDVIERMKIFGVPGMAFGDKENHMRFSMGFLSTEDILRLAPEVYDRWHLQGTPVQQPVDQ